MPWQWSGSPSRAAGKAKAAAATAPPAKKVGERIAKKCLEKGITEVVYDRGGFVYHGRVKALAEGAREAGLKL